MIVLSHPQKEEPQLIFGYYNTLSLLELEIKFRFLS